jgi:hypothetical protein
MQDRHPGADFAFGDAQVSGDTLVGEITLDQAKELELGTHQTAAQLSVCEAVHPGWTCQLL